MTTPLLIDDLKRDEGRRLTAYADTRGVWTCGYGHAGVAPGSVWTLAQADAQLAADIAATTSDLDAAIPWWRGLDPVRQDALANMAFNLGVRGLMGFHHMLSALEAHDFRAASAAMLLSDWAEDPPQGVGERALRLAAMIRSGRRPD
jgi:lysozyme